MEWPEGKSYEGFVNGQPRQMTCKVEVKDLTKFKIDMPEIGEPEFKSSFSGIWNLPVNITPEYIADGPFDLFF